MYLQNRAMQNANLGFNRDALILTSVVGDRDVFVHQMTSFHGIEDVTTTFFPLSSSDISPITFSPSRGDGAITFTVFPVHYSFPETMGVEITEGRAFRREDAGTPYGAFVFNETARQRFNLELGEIIDARGRDAEIVGFMSDVHFTSFRRAVEPMAFIVLGRGGWPLNTAFIRVAPGADKRAAMAHVRATIAELTPTHHQFVETRFFDNVLQQLYEEEIRLSLLITIFSLIAIFLSIVGVFGLVVFDSECRRKEIGIRKVHGASTMGIVLMFNKAYLIILAICFVIAAPIAWLAVSRWLENFAYRTPMYWWVFVLAFLAVTVVTIATITIQNWRVANEDPVKSIKTE
jgi:putative ABC transport system permease protein